MKTSEKKETAMNTTEAAAKLAEAMRANIAAGYETIEAQARRGWLEGAFWNEEGFRRQTRLDVAIANQNATHLACIEALDEYDAALQMERLMAGVRATAEGHGAPAEVVDQILADMEARVRSMSEMLGGPLSDDNRSSNDSACEP